MLLQQKIGNNCQAKGGNKSVNCIGCGGTKSRCQAMNISTGQCPLDTENPDGSNGCCNGHTDNESFDKHFEFHKLTDAAF